MELTSDEVTKMLNRSGYLDLEIPEGVDLVSAIKRLKKEKRQCCWRITTKKPKFKSWPTT